MSAEILLILAVFILGIAGVFWFINQKIAELVQKDRTDKTVIEWLKANQELLAQNNKNITDTLYKNTRDINQRLEKAAQVISELQREAGQFSEVSRSMRDLQEFLKSPKLRGNLGEEVLRDLLSQSFPKNAIHLQYQFRSGDKVDAALKTDAGLLPIDSKFPMENFQRMVGGKTQKERERAKREFTRDVKRHITAISQKYILPEEGTVDFAIMYVPSESVYYEIVNLPEIVEYARQARVYPVSPTTLYAHLKVILASFEGKRIEQRARSVLSSIYAIQKDYEKVSGIMSVLGKHLNNAYNSMSSLASSFAQLGQKLKSAQMLGEETMNEAERLESKGTS